MAHYETSVTTTHSSTEAFAMMADMARFVEWDPGVQSASQTTGTVPGIGAAYRLVVNGVGPAPGSGGSDGDVVSSGTAPPTGCRGGTGCWSTGC